MLIHQLKWWRICKNAWFDFCMAKTLMTLNMRNRFGSLGRGFTPWGFLNQLILHLSFITIITGYYHATLHLHQYYQYVTYCHCNIYLTFSNNTSYYNIINKLQLLIKTTTRTGTHTHQHIPAISYIAIQTYIRTYTLKKNNINKLC